MMGTGEGTAGSQTQCTSTSPLQAKSGDAVSCPPPVGCKTKGTNDPTTFLRMATTQENDFRNARASARLPSMYDYK